MTISLAINLKSLTVNRQSHASSFPDQHSNLYNYLLIRYCIKKDAIFSISHWMRRCYWLFTYNGMLLSSIWWVMWVGFNKKQQNNNDLCWHLLDFRKLTKPKQQNSLNSEARSTLQSNLSRPKGFLLVFWTGNNTASFKTGAEKVVKCVFKYNPHSAFLILCWTFRIARVKMEEQQLLLYVDELFKSDR